MTKQYAQRDIESLDGYMTHVMAMTAEQLNSKSDIAAELAWRDMQIAELRQKLDAMAAENAYLKDSITMHAAGFSECSMCGNEESCETHDIVWMAKETPATDAYLNSVRADVLNELCIAFVQYAELAGLADDEKITLRECTDAVLHCAEQLRSGTHDTADKAGAK